MGIIIAVDIAGRIKTDKTDEQQKKDEHGKGLVVPGQLLGRMLDLAASALICFFLISSCYFRHLRIRIC